MKTTFLKNIILLVLCFLFFSIELQGQLDSLEQKVEVFLKKNITNERELVEYIGNEHHLVEIKSVYNCEKGKLLIKSRVARSSYLLFTYHFKDTIKLIAHGFYNTCNISDRGGDVWLYFRNSVFRRAFISAVFSFSEHTLFVHSEYEVVLSGKVNEGKALIYRFSDGGIDVNDEGEWKDVNTIFYGVHATRDGVAPKLKETTP